MKNLMEKKFLNSVETENSLQNYLLKLQITNL